MSLAEIDKWVKEKYPVLDNKPALMRAYKKTTLKDGDGDAWVEKDEFRALLRNLFYFNKAFALFDQVDKDHDRRVDASEFASAATLLGLTLSGNDIKAAFAKLVRVCVCVCESVSGCLSVSVHVCVCAFLTLSASRTQTAEGLCSSTSSARGQPRRRSPSTVRS